MNENTFTRTRLVWVQETNVIGFKKAQYLYKYIYNQSTLYVFQPIIIYVYVYLNKIQTTVLLNIYLCI